MSLDLRILKRCNQKTKDIVFGYIHSINNEIPKEILNICLLFYSNGCDEWDKDYISQDFKRCGDNILIKTKRSTANAFLKRIMNDGYHEWKFKIPIYNQGSDTLIGIWRIKDNEQSSPPLDLFWFSNGHAFGLHGRLFGDGNTRNHGLSACGHNTIIHMILDFNNLSLSYNVNGITYGKAFDIKPGKYRAAVYLCQKGDSIELIE